LEKCRVYLFTYNRNQLLPRAVQSLLSQTHANWICEVHNDNPEDMFPQKYIESLNDQRFLIVNHTENLGGVRSFNLAFGGCRERYASILEDDNWWEPQFLSEMIALMEENQTVPVAWSNMRLWKEAAGNQWTDTGETVWPAYEGTTCFPWPNPRQAIGALHSTGAMIYRTHHATDYIVPDNSLLNAVELIRERAFEHPLCLNCKPLANFAITLQTYRSNDAYLWTGTQIMLFASFVMAAPNPEEEFQKSLGRIRLQRPNPVAIVFLANLFLIKRAGWYRYLTFSDWIVVSRWLLRNGSKVKYLQQYLLSQNEMYQYLLDKTLLRYKK